MLRFIDSIVRRLASRLPGAPGPIDVGGLLIGGAALWWVAGHAGHQTATVVVHVAEPDVEVALGGRTFRINRQDGEPLVLELPAGPHRLTMSRGGDLLYDEAFDLQRGEWRTLTAWVPRIGVAPREPAP